MRVAAIIVNYKTPDLVLQCLEALSLERATLPDLEAVVVDNASGDGSAEMLSARITGAPLSEWVTFIPLPLNGGFGWGNNQAMLHLLHQKDPPDAFYLLNPDALIQPGALQALADCLTRSPEAAAVGSQLLNTDGTLSGSAFRFPTIAREFMRGIRIGLVGKILGVEPTLVPYGESGPVDWVTGASVLVRTSALGEAGLFDTGFFLYFEEVELMHRLVTHGWKIYHCPESRVMHIAGASTGVIDGKTAGNKVPPDYLFHSRRRYFALTGGTARSVAAGLAWLTGDFLWRIISTITKKQAAHTRDERSALLRIGLRAHAHDASAAFERICDKPGNGPAWMNH